MSKMFGNTNTPKKRMTGVTTGTKIVKMRIENDIEGKIRTGAGATPGKMAGIEVGRGDLGTRKGGAEAQDDIMVMTGMAGEGRESGYCFDQAFCDAVRRMSLSIVEKATTCKVLALFVLITVYM